MSEQFQREVRYIVTKIKTGKQVECVVVEHDREGVRKMKPGDKVVLENGEEATVVHVSKKYDPCKHEWPNSDDGCGTDMSACCTKCGMSFTRFIFTECP